MSHSQNEIELLTFGSRDLVDRCNVLCVRNEPGMQPYIKRRCFLWGQSPFDQFCVERWHLIAERSEPLYYDLIEELRMRPIHQRRAQVIQPILRIDRRVSAVLNRT